MSTRYVVSTVTGYPINPATMLRRPNRPPSTAYAVLDSAVCFRIVREFPAHRQSAGRAQALADQLNREEDALCP